MSTKHHHHHHHHGHHHGKRGHHHVHGLKKKRFVDSEYDFIKSSPIKTNSKSDQHDYKLGQTLEHKVSLLYIYKTF